MVWKHLFRRYTKGMEDHKKVKAKVRELNGDKATGDWDEADGFQMMPKIAFDRNTGQYTIHPDQGISVKLFINTKTGETKIYWAEVFTEATVS